MTVGHPRHQFRSHLELCEQDYHLLEAAAVTTMKHMGLWPHGWLLEDLIDVGWERVFFYAETYEKFERYGYLHAISHMTRYIYAERHRRVHDLWAGKTVGESAERTEYSEPILIPSPAVVLQERERWECTGCGYLAEEQSGVCPKCGQKTWRPVQRREGVPVSPDPEPDGEVTAWARMALKDWSSTAPPGAWANPVAERTAPLIAALAAMPSFWTKNHRP